jgi:Protein of unknown function (DUF2975)
MRVIGPAPTLGVAAGLGVGGQGMRALGPGSVSSFLKVILDVVHVVLWVALAGVGVAMLALLLLPAFQPDFLAGVSVDTNGGKTPLNAAMVGAGLVAASLYLGGTQVIVLSLRRIFMTLTAGDPFHPHNVNRLRLVGAMLGGLELLRYAVWASSAWLLPGVSRTEPNLNLTAWFSVLVVFVLAEVFREGARLRREAELTI